MATRFSRRRRGAAINEATKDNDIPKYPFSFDGLTKAQIREKLSEVDYCHRFGIFYTKCCSGCQTFVNSHSSDSVSIDILNSRDPVDIRKIETALDIRYETHAKAKDCICARPWLINLNDGKSKWKATKTTIEQQQEFIDKHYLSKAIDYDEDSEEEEAGDNGKSGWAPNNNLITPMRLTH